MELLLRPKRNLQSILRLILKTLKKLHMKIQFLLINLDVWLQSLLKIGKLFKLFQVQLTIMMSTLNPNTMSFTVLTSLPLKKQSEKKNFCTTDLTNGQNKTGLNTNSSLKIFTNTTSAKQKRNTTLLSSKNSLNSSRDSVTKIFRSSWSQSASMGITELTCVCKSSRKNNLKRSVLGASQIKNLDLESIVSTLIRFSLILPKKNLIKGFRQAI